MFMTDEQVDKFSKILQAETSARMNLALASMGVDTATRLRGQENLELAKVELYKLVDELTEEERPLFRVFRRTEIGS